MNALTNPEICRYEDHGDCSSREATHVLLTSPTGNHFHGAVCDKHAQDAILSGSFTKVQPITPERSPSQWIHIDDKHTLHFDGGHILILERKNFRGSSRREMTKTPRIYVSAGKSFNAIEDLTNRNRRPHLAWKKQISALLNQLNDTGQLEIEISKMAWNQHAGCSCACSPGFVINDARIKLSGTEIYAKYDIYITLDDAPTIDETKMPTIFALA